VITPAPPEAAGQHPCQYPLTVPPADKSKYQTHGPGIVAPKVIKAPDPQHPHNTGKGPRKGYVMIEAGISETGEIEYAFVINSLSCALDEAALSVLQEWRFQPAMQNDKPIPVKIDIDVWVPKR
jgi:TonB family protein